MKYLVMEIQKFDTGAVSTPTWSYDDVNVAWSKFYTVLASAALSKLPTHSAVIMNESGYCIDHKCFNYVEPAPEPEPDTEPEE